jgi:hypothetical protein
MTGVTGTSGAQGLTGATGTSGAQGLTGVTGTSGAQGLTGATGTSGVQGMTGVTGTSGAQGLTGATGTSGVQGMTGVTGTSGGALGGSTYCDGSNVSSIGSSGGSDDGANNGRGGGLIKLEAVNDFTINGYVSADGTVGAGDGGGGAGGGIKIAAKTILGIPLNFSAYGGASGGANAGGGGGGCVQVTYKTSTSIGLGQIGVTGGSGFVSGSAGTKSITQLPPATPVGPLVTNNISTQSITASWSAGNGGETYYVVEFSTNTIDFSFVSSTPLSTTTYSFSGLSPNSQYTFRVASSNGSATSTYITSAPAYTLAAPASSVLTSNPTTSTINVYWNTSLSNPTSTEYAILNSSSLKYITASGFETTSSTFFTSSSWSGSVKGLVSNADYQFVVIAKNTSGITSTTSSPSVSTSTLINVPGSPTASSTTSTNSLAVSLNPNNNSSSTTYALYLLPTNTHLTSSGLAAGGPTYFSTSSWNGYVFGLSPNSSYQFLAYTSNSLVSNTSTAVYTAASVPTSVLATTNNGSQITVSWSGDATNYFVENVTAGTNSGWVSGSSTVFSGLQCGTSYDFRVKGRNNDLVETGFSSHVSNATSGCITTGGGASISFFSPPASLSTSSNNPFTSTPPSITPGGQNSNLPLLAPPLSSTIFSPPIPSSTTPPSVKSSSSFSLSNFLTQSILFFSPDSSQLTLENGSISSLSCTPTEVEIFQTSFSSPPSSVTMSVAPTSTLFSSTKESSLVAEEFFPTDYSPVFLSTSTVCGSPTTTQLIFSPKEKKYSEIFSLPEGSYKLTFIADYKNRSDEKTSLVFNSLVPGAILANSSDITTNDATVSLQKVENGTIRTLKQVASPSSTYGFFTPSTNSSYILEIRTRDGRFFKTLPFSIQKQVLNRPVVLVGSTPLVTTPSSFPTTLPPQSLPSQSTISPFQIISLSFALFSLFSLLAQTPFSTVLNLLRLLFLQPLRGKREEGSFGIVYNSLSKQPISLVLVRLIDTQSNRLIQSRVSDEKGRFFFHATPGTYRLEASKAGLTFPSAVLKSFSEDGKFKSVYHGETIVVSEKSPLLSAQIPLDPPEISPSRARLFRNKIFNTITKSVSIFGLVAGCLLLARSPTDSLQWVSFSLQTTLFILFWFFSSPKKPKKWGVVYDHSTKKPVSRAVARLFNTEYNKLVDSQISDSQGRFFFSAGGSRFKVIAEHPKYKNSAEEEFDLKGKDLTIISPQIRL